MYNLTETFGSDVFDDSTMRERLPRETYTDLMRTIQADDELDYSTALVVASAMKEWAVEKGATHYCHWFQPMTGVTAEKHDSFISPAPGGKAIMEFSGKELIKGESDASSFPSGGLRATFEARGYTAWDPTSNAFVLNGTLYIPTAFCSYSGIALDKKTPLLRSMSALNRQSLRILRILDNTASTKVTSTLGVEQEYFIIDKELYQQRPDLIYSGRTLYGSPPPKGQEMDLHYYGHIKPRISKFMQEVDRELWRLGVYAKTRHNEAAPAQHELACIYNTCNIATDHNQLVMEVLKTIADAHGLVCLLHEKPFAAVNGSGKHNNWGLFTDDGINLLKPGKTPEENRRFLIFLLAVIKAVDDYPELIRLSVASYSNDLRLGGNEAPPSIISIFLGEQLTAILRSIAAGSTSEMVTSSWVEIGVASIPRLKTDNTDRNRTSPFAFTGNRFEFRMPGSSLSMADPNLIINTAVAESLKQFADALEGNQDMEAAIDLLLQHTAKKHERIVFNGNNYSTEWFNEAKERGLPILKSSVDAIPHYLDRKSIELFSSHDVLDETELVSRCEIYLENYVKTATLEAETMLDMARRLILPAAVTYSEKLLTVLEKKKALAINADLETRISAEVAETGARILNLCDELHDAIVNLKSKCSLDGSVCWHDHILPIMDRLRTAADHLETITDASIWPFPTYGALLFKI